jgi:hypothetical protein
VRDRILSHDGIERVKIWKRDGEIIYSDEPRLIGDNYTLGADDQASLTNGNTEAETMDLSRPENRFDRGLGELLEVYLPIHAPDGEPLLFETYIRSAFVDSASGRVWSTLGPVLIGALLVLAALQLPLAWSLARRLRRGQRERELLLRRAIDASEMERRRIAQDLHDGVVQDLAGASYSLAAAGARDGETAGANGELMRKTAARLRQSVRDLRGLLVEIYPADLHRAGLGAALSDVVAGIDARGIHTVLEVPPDLSLPEELETLFFRVAQESIRNVVAHSGASTLRICAARSNGTATLVPSPSATSGTNPLPSSSTRPATTTGRDWSPGTTTVDTATSRATTTAATTDHN